MPVTKVTDEQGNIHVFPDGSTPEMIAKAMGVKPAPEAAIQQQPSGGFLQGVYDNTVQPLVDLEKQGFQEIQQNPGGGPLQLGASLLGKVLSGPARLQYAEGKKAVQSFKQENYSEAGGHGLAAALPFFGPAAAKAGEDIGAGTYGAGTRRSNGLDRLRTRSAHCRESGPIGG